MQIIKNITKYAALSALSLSVAGMASAETGVTDTEILIGSVTALSGPASVWGVGGTAGARMKFDEVNAAGGIHGRQIKFLVEDHGYQVPKAIQGANKLINRDGVFAMVLSLGTPHNNAMFNMMMGKGVPSLFPFTAAISMTEPHHKLKFSNTSTYYDQTRAGLKYLVENNGRSKICALYQDTDFGHEIRNGTRDQAAAMGMDVVLEVTHGPGDTDFTSQIGQIKAAGCDLVALGSIIKDAIIPLATARKMGLKIGEDIDFTGALASASKIVAGVDGGLTEGFYVGSLYGMVYEDSGSELGMEWAKAYKAYSGQDADNPAMLGYDSAALLVLALEKAGKKLTRNKLVSAIEDMKNVPSNFSELTYSFSKKQHRGTNKSVLMQVQNGKFVVIEDSVSY